MKFHASQCGDLIPEEEFNIVFNAKDGSPKNRRQAEIALALSSRGTGRVNFRLLDDIPVRLMPHMLGALVHVLANLVIHTRMEATMESTRVEERGERIVLCSLAQEC